MPHRRIPAHPLLTRFVAITIVLVVALGVLGWRMLEQDRALERQRTRDRLEDSAELIAAGLLRGLAALGDSLARLAAAAPAGAERSAARMAAALPSDGVVLLARPSGLDAFPRGRLLFDPAPPSGGDAPAAVFATGDSLEFRARDPAAAAVVFRRLAASPDPAIRAGALVRLGRAERKAQSAHGTRATRFATAAYDELAQLDDASVGGVPAPVVARAARLAIWSETGETSALAREARELRDGLRSARWRVSRPTFEFYDAEASRALAMPPAPNGDETLAMRMAASDASASLWTAWRSDDAHAPSGARVLRAGERAFLALWHTRGDRMAAMLGGPSFVERMLIEPLAPAMERQRVRVSLADDRNRAVVASLPAASEMRVTRAMSETRLPWTLYVSSVGAASGDVAERRRLLIAGLAVAALLALLGTYAVSRAAERELTTARLQADFVAAVSHEFRTPLTSLRQLTELLAAGRVSSTERRSEYYEAMRRETARLHRFVEGLLDFGRADAGMGERRNDPLDAAKLVRDTVQEFAGEAAARGFTVELSGADEPAVIRGDAEALERALWNLLDNAVKYSGDARTVNVAVERMEGWVGVRVRDNGIGIPHEEQDAVWAKFRRGAGARERGIRGTGIGLAIVRQVVEAHGGRVSLTSEPERGSTFEVRIPRSARDDIGPRDDKA